MTISADYITLQRKIADDIGNRTDLLSALSDSGLTTSPIQDAIQSAIAKWERESFYFNEVYQDPVFSTVSGQERYTTADAAMLATSPDFLLFHILVSNNRYTLHPRTWQYIDGISVNAANTGQPTDFAYFAETLRLYPIPNAVYPVTASGIKRFPALSADADANVWTQDAFDLIRSEAKLILARETLHDDDIAARMQVAIYGSGPRERGYLYALKGESTQRASSRIIPTQF